MNVRSVWGQGALGIQQAAGAWSCSEGRMGRHACVPRDVLLTTCQSEHGRTTMRGVSRCEIRGVGRREGRRVRLGPRFPGLCRGLCMPLCARTSTSDFCPALKFRSYCACYSGDEPMHRGPATARGQTRAVPDPRVVTRAGSRLPRPDRRCIHGTRRSAPPAHNPILYAHPPAVGACCVERGLPPGCREATYRCLTV